jgi:hypothetical protein
MGDLTGEDMTVVRMAPFVVIASALGRGIFDPSFRLGASQTGGPNSGPQLGDRKITEASIAVLSYRVGATGEFEANKAAIVDFASAADHPLSPFSIAQGLPPNLFSKTIADRIDVAFEIGRQVTGKVNPGISDAVANMMDQARGVLNRTGPYQAYTVIQTQTYTEKSTLFGLITWNTWVNDPRVVTPVNTGPLLRGMFIDPISAAAAASAALRKQVSPPDNP